MQLVGAASWCSWWVNHMRIMTRAARKVSICHDAQVSFDLLTSWLPRGRREENERKKARRDKKMFRGKVRK